MEFQIGQVFIKLDILNKGIVLVAPIGTHIIGIKAVFNNGTGKGSGDISAMAEVYPKGDPFGTGVVEGWLRDA